MNDVLFTPLRLNELETLIQHSVERAIKVIYPSKSQADIQNDKFLTVEEAAKFLNLTVQTIYGLVSKNEISHMKRNRRLYFSRKDLVSYVETGRKKSNAEIEADADAYLSNNKKRVA